MLFDGKLDAVDLMAIEHEQRQTDLRRVVNYIKKNYLVGDSIDPDEVTSALNIRELSDNEVDYVTRQLKK